MTIICNIKPLRNDLGTSLIYIAVYYTIDTKYCKQQYLNNYNNIHVIICSYMLGISEM